jgi:hypothetical protein
MTTRKRLGPLARLVMVAGSMGLVAWCWSMRLVRPASRG